MMYVLVCGLLYFMQEKMIFFPVKLRADYKFNYTQKFEEISVLTSDKLKLSGLLFKADSAKGLIFYLHGNGGALDTWGNVAKPYTDLNYDIFILDYRGYGKSEGEISNEKQLYGDVQSAYDQLKKRYAENNIVIVGYSIGTGPASMLASKNAPKMLILQAPYFSLSDMMNKEYPFVPDFLLRYKFDNYAFVKKAKAPVLIFHGNADEVIYYGSSLKLQKYFKSSDRLITLQGQAHNGMNENADFLKELKRVLSAD